MAIGKLMSIIAEEDTVTGFLLGGIGQLDKERNSNFLVSTVFSREYRFYALRISTFLPD